MRIALPGMAVALAMLRLLSQAITSALAGRNRSHGASASQFGRTAVVLTRGSAELALPHGLKGRFEPSREAGEI